MRRRQPDAQPLLRYATHATHAPLYRAIVDFFAEAAAGYASRLRPEDVHAALAGDFGPSDDDPSVPTLTVADIAERLEKLAEWGNLSRDHDSSRATSLDAYERVAYIYDLTPGGESAHEALQALEDGLRRVGGLQSVALRQIDEMLTGLYDLVCAAEPDGQRIYGICEDLHSRFRSLTGNATVFMQKVNRLLCSAVLELGEFAMLKADTIAYLSEFLTDLDTVGAQIRRRLSDLDRLEPARLQAALAAGGVASGELVLTSDDRQRSWVQTADVHLRGLADWFRADADSRAGAALLYSKAREAILGITRVVDRIREAASSPSSRSADLLNLAERFAGCADDHEAHILWHCAFGLASARHLGLASADDAVPSATSWWDPAGAADVPVRLRTSGRTDYVRRATTVTDRRAAKQLLAADATARLHDDTAAAQVLVALGTVRISDINALVGGPVEHLVLRRLAHLIFRAQKARPRPDGSRRATSVDGVLEITVVESRPLRAARLVATTGTWTLPDYTVEVAQRQLAGSTSLTVDVSDVVVGPLVREPEVSASW